MAGARKTEHKNFRLGDWQVDPNVNSLSFGALRRQLEPRAMDVLLFLVQQSGAVVSAEQLLAECWGGTFQGDNAVHKIITQLRRALDDPSGEPRYIETIRKRGYRILAELAYDDEATTGSWVHDSPFRGLEPFEEKHAAIFFGRKLALKQLMQTALAQVHAACAMVLILGPSGSGKTSLIRAGFIPQLMSATAPAADAMPAITCSLYLDCADLGNTDLFQALASVLLDSEVDGRLLFVRDSAESLGQRMADDMGAVVSGLQQQLPVIRLVLFIDRFEAIFRLPHVDEASRHRFVTALEQLARSGCVLLVLACRNDFYPHLATYPELVELKRRGGHFDLAPPKGNEIAQIILQPARAAQLQFSVDETSGERLDDALCDAAKGSPDTLPLLQYCLQELYRQRNAAGELSYAVFKNLGGIEGAIGERAEQVFSSLTSTQAAALPRVLSQLVIVSEDELAVTSLRLPWSALDGPAENELVKTLIDARLFVSDLHGGVAAFGIAHEALLRRWPRVVAWIETHRRTLQTRSRIRAQALRWRASDYSRDMLLPRGTQANQAKNLLQMAEFTFSEQEQAFIRASLQRVKRGEYVRLAAFCGLVGLAALASGLGLVARSAEKQAEEHRNEAEGLMTFMLGEFIDKLRPLGRLDLLDSVSARALSYLSGAQNAEANTIALTQRAKALQVISEVKIARGDTVEASRALHIARDILLRQLKEAPADKAILKSAGENAFWLGQINFDQKDWPNAEKYFVEYRDLSNRLAAADPADVDGWIEQSYAHNSLGSLALQRGDIQRGADEFAQSVHMKARAFAQTPNDQRLAVDLADSLSWLADARKRQGKFAEAAKLYEREFDIILPLHEAIPDNALWTNHLSSALSHQAELKRISGDDAAALGYFSQAEALLKSIVKRDPSNRTWQRNLSIAQLEIFDIEANALGEIPALARLAALNDDVAVLSKLEPKKINLQLLLAKIQKRQAYIKFKYASPGAADQDIMAAVGKLEKLHAYAPADQVIRDALTDALLLQADIDFAQHGAQSARDSCRKVQALLEAPVAGSTDFHLLVPWIRSHLCLGEDVNVVDQRNLLEKMHYRERAYLHYISTRNLKNDPNESK
ncbi:AAA family ATPase [Collimonas pratensis]|uniref:nSTAND1 domain-containing NTPase n=1 Tax=Collimonas pratensis TaxID=279113 RepID=UPI00143D7458|nr:winged helix-turn-helix domain-containing protein [Collimonas pratensis]NKI71231.1 AAA family ATPase [Collimonas pratensis]